MRLILHATNISSGGGKSLLTALVASISPEIEVVALFDSRIALLTGASVAHAVKRVSPTILDRLLAERWLAKNVNSRDLIICFGSLPPLFKLRGHVIVFLQNRYLIEKNNISGFPFKTKLRLFFERTWLKCAASNADEYIVQTPAMKTVIQNTGILNEQSIHIRPFTDESIGYMRDAQHLKNDSFDRRFDFIYVASGEPHKNHRQLIKAWCLMAEQNLYPSLCLTLDKDVSIDLCLWIERQKDKYMLNVTNEGQLSHFQVLELYRQASALIYPSCLESFGLPLIEASQAGLPILAAELDYVRDVLDPAQSFDPDSPVSIARAVKRFMGVAEEPLPLLDASQFLNLLLRKYMQ